VTHSDLCLIIVVILFAVVAVIRAMAKSIDGTLVAIGLAVFALAFVVT
jgi:hypothetical protein